MLPRADFPLEVAVAPFAGEDGAASAAVVLALPPEFRLGGSPHVDLLTRAVDRDGQVAKTLRQTLEIAPSASPGPSLEILSDIPLEPGPYELRFGVSVAGGGSASVYTNVDVPDFRGGRFSASGLVLSASSSSAPIPADALRQPLPVAPTVRRAFHHSDQVTAYSRTYQRGTDLEATPTAAASILDESGAVLWSEERPLGRVAFAGLHACEYVPTLPLHALPAGEYVLKVVLQAGPDAVSRTVRFRID